MEFWNTIAFNATFMDDYYGYYAFDEIAVSKPNAGAINDPCSSVVFICGGGGDFDLESMHLAPGFEYNNVNDTDVLIRGYAENLGLVGTTTVKFDHASDVVFVEFPETFKNIVAVEILNWDDMYFGFDDIKVVVNSPCQPNYCSNHGTRDQIINMKKSGGTADSGSTSLTSKWESFVTGHEDSSKEDDDLE